MTRTPSLNIHDFTVGWICGLLVEYTAALSILDEIYHTVTGILPAKNDHNIYTLGRIGNHNVVVVSLPTDSPGIVSASIVEANIRTTFPSIQFSLMVGIAGASPQPKNDVRLGDVVIGTKVVPYLFGKTTPHGFEYTGYVPRPPDILLRRVNHMMYRCMVNLDIALLIEEKTRHLPNPLRRMFLRPEMADRLYISDYVHEEECNCQISSSPSPSHLISRDPRPPGPQLVVHSGTIASGDQVMKDARTRDELAKRFNILCFDMESAGLTRGALTIRGIDNYADSHKNDKWHGYAAMAAAVFAAEFLKMVPVGDVPVPNGPPNMTNEMRVLIDEVRRIKDGAANERTAILAMNAKLGILEQRLGRLDQLEETIRNVESKVDLAMERLWSCEDIHNRVWASPGSEGGV
ncbi:purine and uridine phosphorylase, partial [Aspergillus sclerotioniger CBS 115572]